MYNYTGEYISGQLVECAAQAGQEKNFELDPLHLLALIGAESGYGANPLTKVGPGWPNAYAERWGSETRAAREAITNRDMERLQDVVNRTWPDISFGYSQRIVLYHDVGNRSKTWQNCLAVREAVFYSPKEDMLAAARRLIDCHRHVTTDGSILGAMICYNAGSDQRENQEWLTRWGSNLASYKLSLEWAEQFRRGPLPI